ncbi:MAG: GatB/YqeY domain-containing protein [Geitlerinemataceae cyanobacterium]
MSLKDRIGEEIKAAMKARDKMRLNTVRSIKKAILEKEISVRPQGRETLNETEEMELVMQLAKQRRDSIEQFEQAGRDDLADRERQELEVLEEYLPQQMGDEEIAAAVDAAIAKVGASSPKDMGKVMGPLMQELKGRADGKKIQTIVKEKLAN